jgi:aquaporin rerated protein, other eukaryote
MNIEELPENGGFILPWTKTRRSGRSKSWAVTQRLPFAQTMHPNLRGHLVSMLGELVGTFLFLFFAFTATQVANVWAKDGLYTGSTMLVRLFYISLAFGFSLIVNAWTFFRVSGALFNPAVNWGMCLVGALTWVRGGLLFIAQLLGAISAAAVVTVLFPGALLVETLLGAGTNTAQGLFIEAFLTFELILVIFMLAAEKHSSTHFAPVGMYGSLMFFVSTTDQASQRPCTLHCRTRWCKLHGCFTQSCKKFCTSSGKP